MFLDWIAQLQLLQHDAQTDILSVLPLATRKSLVQAITTYLHPPQGHPTPDPSVFSSLAHVKWFMEVIGQGFTLPLEDMQITTDDITIYAQWLFELNQRPKAVREEGLEQEFFQIIFHQYSLLFEPRGPKPVAPSNRPTSTGTSVQNVAIPLTLSLGTPGLIAHTSSPGLSPAVVAQQQREKNAILIQRHQELCKKVLTVFAMAGRTLGPTFTKETWIVLLKVVLGITDYLLSDFADGYKTPYGKEMANELCVPLLRVLFELWLRSKIEDVELWNIFKKCFRRWTHRAPVIQQWNAASLALTQRSIRILYGPTEGTDIVNIMLSGTSIPLDLPDEFVLYAWHRTLYMIPNPCTLPPSNFFLALQGIGRDQKGPLPSPPDGNTILHMFGEWLFEATYSTNRSPQDQEAQLGRAEAFGILCRIFSQTQTRNAFLRTYIERFYVALAVGLRSDSCLPTILANSTKLFAVNLEGIRMLLPDFVVGVKMVLPRLATDMRLSPGISLESLRLSAMKICAAIMSLPNHYENVHLSSGWDQGMQPVGDILVGAGDQERAVTELLKVLYIQDASDAKPNALPTLKRYILEVLVASLRTEVSSYNLRMLLHLLNVYAVQEVYFCPGLAATIVQIIQAKLMTMTLPPDVALNAFQVLMDLVHLHEYVKRDSKNTPRELVLALCRYVNTLLSSGNLTTNYPLIVSAYDCTIRWVLAGQWIVDDHDCCTAVINTISMGITLPERGSDMVASIDVQIDKKKKRETAFPPPKQLFALQNRSKQINANGLDANGVVGGGLNKSNPGFHRKEELAVKLAAEYCMSQFVNQLGNFPPWRNETGVTRTSTLFDDLKHIKTSREEDPISKGEDEVTHIEFYIIDGRTIISIVDLATAEPVKVDLHGKLNTATSAEPRFLLVMRDTTGKYSWLLESRYQELKTKATSRAKDSTDVSTQDSSSESFSVSMPQLTIHGISNSNSPATPSSPCDNIISVKAVNEDQLPTLDELLEAHADSMALCGLIRTLADDQQRMESAAIGRAVDTRSHSISPSSLSHRDISTRHGYHMLSQLGFLSLENRDRIIPLKVNDNIINQLRTLDTLNDHPACRRECVTISVLYSRTGFEDPQQIIARDNAEPDSFRQFLSSLGWMVDLSSHTGYCGRLDPTFCPSAPYYADRHTEMIFNSPTLLKIPTDQTTDEGFPNPLQLYQRICSDDFVCVLWVDDLLGYRRLSKRLRQTSNLLPKAMVFIFVNPLSGKATGLFWVRIVIPPGGHFAMIAAQRLADNPLAFGPLVDGMIISQHALGVLIRNTSLSAHQACRVVTESYTRPFLLRKQFIDEFYHRSRTHISTSDLFTEILTHS
ncbi:hypothetical protein BZG36_03602 [Bifiguratus adelaidae]|uniref:Rap-GAP domain-containing protein n=1 Tax=Bifiguratus adelaidae TaxID=1938954 RepID=A0A261XYM9_9FUNG|nr:hypothetical protein BZG36_03602 [Bifiguratus adelaidae]